MPTLNWGLIQDGGVLESLMHAILYAENSQTILFGRSGKDSGQDARTVDGTIVYQSKYRRDMDMDEAIKVALKELETITMYLEDGHTNYDHWKNATRWVLFANLSINPNDDAKWKSKVVPEFKRMRLVAEYWTQEVIEGKLAENPQIREVFFGQENRVLVGLKEAHDLLKNERIGGEAWDIPMLGRTDELALVRDFINSPEKRILPVIGPGGIGKSRFLYECLVTLSQEGWRVLWGLPEAMVNSSQWFRLVNGTQKTCVALDTPEELGLLRKVIEQLSTVERRNWRVIISCRSENSEVLRWYKNHRSFNEAIRLDVLNESLSKDLINNILGDDAEDAWLHTVYRFTRGNPGWLCMIAELTKQGNLKDLPSRADDIAFLYVKTSLTNFNEETSERARILLRWLALWGAFAYEAGSNEQNEIVFLEREGIPRETLNDLLKKLVETGLVRNWGIGKRCYGIDSLLIRQYVLSDWLLQETEPGVYSVSPAGTDLVSKLLSARLPCVEATFQTISHLSLSRLESQATFSLLRPIFDVMAATAKETDLLGQNHITELVAKLGVADPESALDVLTTIRENAKDDQEIENSFWGKSTFTRNELLSTLSWTLFTLAERVDIPDVSYRFLVEFRELAKLVESDLKPSDPGKSPQQLLSRIICKSRNSSIFAEPAFKMVNQHLTSEEWWPFIGDLAKCILDPRRETKEWVANWTLGFSRYTLSTKSSDWNRLLGLRKKLFTHLQSEQHKALHDRIWSLLSDSHHSCQYAVNHFKMSDRERQNYRAVLIDDLTRCVELLKTPRTLGEATRARSIWEWYLKYEKDDRLVATARECEQLYNGVSAWRLHDFFRFDSEEELAPETKRIAEMLRNSTSENTFFEFFDEATKYLDAARKNRDTADDWRLGDLAANLADLFSFDPQSDTTGFSAFALGVLVQGDDVNRLARFFVIMVCRIRLGQVKADGEDVASKWLDDLLSHSLSKGPVLWGLYANAHPSSTGSITDSEIERIWNFKETLSKLEWFWLLGVMVGSGHESILESVKREIESVKNDRTEASNCLSRFLDSSQLAYQRFNQTPQKSIGQWIFEAIGEYQLNGSLLEEHAFEWIRDSSGFQPSMIQFAKLMDSRVNIDTVKDLGDRFEVVPHDFKVNDWCHFDSSNNEDVNAFFSLCGLVLQGSFTATYWIPKYLVQIDPSGELVAAFVKRHLAEHAGLDVESVFDLAHLASEYPANSQAWAEIACPICARTQGMRREDREHIFFGLSRKESGVMVNMPGEISSNYLDAYSEAQRLKKEEPGDSPLTGYRDWALRSAKEDLQREEGRAEEFRND